MLLSVKSLMQQLLLWLHFDRSNAIYAIKVFYGWKVVGEPTKISDSEFWLKSVLHNIILSKKGLFTAQTKNVSLRHADYRLPYTTCIKRISNVTGMRVPKIT